MNIETAARTPIQNRKVHAESDFGIRNREIMIHVCEFGKGTVKRKPKEFKWLKSDSQIDHFQFLKFKQTKAHESLWNQNQSYRAEQSATANELHCHGSCSKQHAPRQRSSSLSLNVRQNYSE
jgi:hypothetical protein